MTYEGCWEFGNMEATMYGTHGSSPVIFIWIFSLLAITALILSIVYLIKQIKK